MQSISAYEAKTHLPRLLDRVAGGESVVITRHGRPVARLVPVENEARDCARHAARRIIERRARLARTSISELMDSVHEGHRF